VIFIVKHSKVSINVADHNKSLHLLVLPGSEQNYALCIRTVLLSPCSCARLYVFRFLQPKNVICWRLKTKHLFAIYSLCMPTCQPKAQVAAVINSWYQYIETHATSVNILVYTENERGRTIPKWRNSFLTQNMFTEGHICLIWAEKGQVAVLFYVVEVTVLLGCSENYVGRIGDSFWHFFFFANFLCSFFESTAMTPLDGTEGPDEQYTRDHVIWSCHLVSAIEWEKHRHIEFGRRPIPDRIHLFSVFRSNSK
jgi:hypothetical protein